MGQFFRMIIADIVNPCRRPGLGAAVARGLVELLGADHIIFGSDYPHVEGLANPVSYIDELSGLPEEDIRKIMGGNMMGLLGAKVPAPA